MANDAGDVAGPSTSTATPAGTALLGAARAAARLSKQLEVALTHVDLTLPQYRALAFIARGALAPSALAGQLAVSRPTITALIDGLAARHFVERHPDPHDGRRVEHRLTEAGLEILEAADTAVAERLGALAEHLPARDRDRAVQGLLLWAGAIDAAHGPAPATTPTGGRP
jgi:long-chain acyl-CoA synthetase